LEGLSKMKIKHKHSSASGTRAAAEKPPRVGVLQRVRQALRKLAFGQLRLKRADKGLKLAWGESLMIPPVQAATAAAPPVSVHSTRPLVKGLDSVAPQPRKRSGKDGSTPSGRTPVQQMRVEVKAALSARPNGRVLMAQLACFDGLLKRHGLDALDQVPVKLLLKAQAQLELATGAMPMLQDGLLMKAMAEAAQRRGGSEPADAGFDPQRSLVGQVVVRDAALSDFLDAHKAAHAAPKASAAPAAPKASAPHDAPPTAPGALRLQPKA
jgi:hypothetical protein